MLKIFLKSLFVILLLVSPCFAGVDFDNTDDVITAPSASINLDIGTVNVWIFPNFNLDQTSALHQIHDTDTTRYSVIFNSAASDVEMFNE